MRIMLLTLIAYCSLSALEAPELTMEQKLQFQTKLTEFYIKTATVNNLQAAFESELTDRAKQIRAELARQQMAKSAAEQALRSACPGEVTGLDKDAAVCTPKSTPAQNK